MLSIKVRMICRHIWATKGTLESFAATELFIKIFAPYSFDITDADYEYFTVICGYTTWKVLFPNTVVCIKILHAVFWDTDNWSFIGVCDRLVLNVFLCNCWSSMCYSFGCQNHYFSDYFPVQWIEVLICFENWLL